MSTPFNKSNTNASSSFIPAILNKSSETTILKEPKQMNAEQIGKNDNENQRNKAESDKKIDDEPNKKNEGIYT